jgi:hypothetical protein
LSSFLHYFLTQPATWTLFSLFAVNQGLPAALQLVVSRLFPEVLPSWNTHLTSHCIRVGTCTTLIKLGVSADAIKAWIGWFPQSKAWVSYIRAPVFTLPECEFAARVFAGALPFVRAS